MVQNQMTPAYQYAQTGLEEFHHQVVVSQPTAVAAEAAAAAAAAQFKADQTPFTAATVTTNGGVEQQTVRPRPINVRHFYIVRCLLLTW